MKKLLVLVVLFVAFLTVKSQNQDSIRTLINIQPNGYVNDYQGLFTTEQKDTLNKMISDYEKKTTIEFALVTYWVDPMDYNPQDIVDLAERWGVGKKGVDNGFLMFLSYSTEKGQSNFLNLTGYGLEPFLPDGKLNNIEYKIYPTTLYVGNVYEAYKQYIVACQNELGDDGYDMLVESKRVRDIERTEANKKAFNIFLFVLGFGIILSIVIFLVRRYIRKREEYFELKTNIEKLGENIEHLKNTIGVLPENYQIIYDSRKTSFSKNEITEESKSELNYVYTQLLEYRSIINNIETSLTDISDTGHIVKTYLGNIPYHFNFCKEHPNCHPYIEVGLNGVLSNVDMVELRQESGYTKKRMNKLTGIKIGIDRKMEAFNTKMVKVGNIIKDNEEIVKKEKDLTTLYNEFTRKRNILIGSSIGSRVIKDVDFNSKLKSMKDNLATSFEILKTGDLNEALVKFGNYVVTETILKSNMSEVTSLYEKLQKSTSYLKANKIKLSSEISNIEGKINHSGVSYSRKSKLSDIKSNVTKYKSTLGVDIILAATLLKTILSDSASLSSSIRSDISSYEYQEARRIERVNSSSSSGSSSGGGSFGGGSFGGGGSGGSF